MMKEKIKNDILAFQNQNLKESTKNLFNTLGYKSERTTQIKNSNYQGFKDAFFDAGTVFNKEKALIHDWKSVDLIFQLTDDELGFDKDLKNKNINTEEIMSYLFLAIELTKSEYTRTQLAQISREINKVFSMPVLTLFKYGNLITFSVINRRLNKLDRSKDVLEKITMIKDISILKPHRAHLEILRELSTDNITANNFKELHQAWEKALDIQVLNRRFYTELSNWYFWALQEAHFPTTNGAADKNSLLKEKERVKEHNAKNLIRLLTRLLFVWFVKEKNLIPEEIFDINYIKDKLLKDFEPDKKKGFDYKTQGSKYYRAILQNLFFATLNQTVDNRQFRKADEQRNVTNLMRYESYFKDPELFIELVKNTTPFMNGGLFECLDTPDPVKRGKQGGDFIIYEDGFSDRKDNTLCVPDHVFFGVNEQVDLSDELGAKYKKVTVNGLIHILKNYKFTVMENTPIEEDIALDPELLGRVFENLLASYNPETNTTARKQSGSFYTPREIVNYMVDETLKAYLKHELVTKASMNAEKAESALEYLIGYIEYNEEEDLFDTKQINLLINAIDNCKIIDPACGSGAFPMGILHKLVHILHKLDPKNELWKKRQIDKVDDLIRQAEAITDSNTRDKIINDLEENKKDIESAFLNNDLDYGRKLYLIENCIYGVDIQPIAIQISKLRFFISLIIDQKADRQKSNFGIRPLPNLETKFVAANTLIGVKKPKKQMTIFDAQEDIKDLEERLKEIRHRMFSAKTPRKKRELREKDKEIRNIMSKKLEEGGWSNESANQLAEWDPYNQNISSNWFESAWMFGVKDGFDIVIGNPPYASAVTMARSNEEKKYFKQYYPEATGSYDIYILFLLKTLALLNKHSYYSWIIPNKFLVADYSYLTKEKLIKHGLLSSIDVSTFNVFENASVYPIIIIGSNSFVTPFMEFFIEKYNDLSVGKLIKTEKVKNYSTFFDAGIKISSGATGFEAEKLKGFLYDVYDKDSVPFVVSGSIDRYFHCNRNVRFMGLKLEKAYIKKSCPVADSKWQLWNNEKIIIAGMTKVIEATYVKTPLALGVGVYAIHFFNNYDPYFITAVLNSKFLSYYINTKFKHKHLAGGYLAINKTTIEQLPFIKPSRELEKKISDLSKEIFLLKNNKYVDTKKNENQIDQLVYQLYGLTEEEIAIVEKE